MVRSQEASSLTIGRLAAAVGVGVETIRFYQRRGLLATPTRGGGVRRYGPEDLRRLRFIRQAQAAGFTLEEIRELLELSSRRMDDMAGMKAAAIQKLADVEAKVAELNRMRAGLQALVASCPGHGAMNQCPILNALAEGAR